MKNMKHTAYSPRGQDVLFIRKGGLFLGTALFRNH
jgi:hypothetical protein